MQELLLLQEEKKKEKKKKETTGESRVWVEDECKCRLKTIVRKVIAKRGSKPCLPVQDSPAGIPIYAALQAQTGQVVVQLADRLDSAATKSFLYQLKKQLGPGRAYLIWDGHGSHVSAATRTRAKKHGIHLVQQPPRCPHLNPVEEIWRQLKNELANRLFTTLEELKEAILAFFETRNYQLKIDVPSYFS